MPNLFSAKDSEVAVFKMWAHQLCQQPWPRTHASSCMVRLHTLQAGSDKLKTFRGSILDSNKSYGLSTNLDKTKRMRDWGFRNRRAIRVLLTGNNSFLELETYGSQLLCGWHFLEEWRQNFKHSWNAIVSLDSDSQFQLVQQVESTWEDLAILRF